MCFGQNSTFCEKSCTFLFWFSYSFILTLCIIEWMQFIYAIESIPRQHENYFNFGVILCIENGPGLSILFRWDEKCKLTIKIVCNCFGLVFFYFVRFILLAHILLFNLFSTKWFNFLKLTTIECHCYCVTK